MTEELTAHEIDLATAYEREKAAEVQRQKAQQYEQVLAQKRAKNQQAAKQERLDEAAGKINKLAGEYRALRDQRNRAIAQLTIQAGEAKALIRQASEMYRKLADGCQALAYMRLQDGDVSPPQMAFEINSLSDQILLDAGAKEDSMPPAKLDAVLRL